MGKYLEQWFSTGVLRELLLNIENRVLFHDIYFFKIQQQINILSKQRNIIS